MTLDAPPRLMWPRIVAPVMPMMVLFEPMVVRLLLVIVPETLSTRAVVPVTFEFQVLAEVTDTGVALPPPVVVVTPLIVQPCAAQPTDRVRVAHAAGAGAAPPVPPRPAAPPAVPPRPAAPPVPPAAAAGAAAPPPPPPVPPALPLVPPRPAAPCRVPPAVPPVAVVPAVPVVPARACPDPHCRRLPVVPASPVPRRTAAGAASRLPGRPRLPLVPAIPLRIHCRRPRARTPPNAIAAGRKQGKTANETSTGLL